MAKKQNTPTAAEQIEELKKQLAAAEKRAEDAEAKLSGPAPQELPTFKAKVDGKAKTFEFVYPRVIVSGNRNVSAEEALEDPEIIAELVSIKSGAIKEVEKS